MFFSQAKSLPFDTYDSYLSSLYSDNNSPLQKKRDWSESDDSRSESDESESEESDWPETIEESERPGLGFGVLNDPTVWLSTIRYQHSRLGPIADWLECQNPDWYWYLRHNYGRWHGYTRSASRHASLQRLETAKRRIAGDDTNIQDRPSSSLSSSSSSSLSASLGKRRTATKADDQPVRRHYNHKHKYHTNYHWHKKRHVLREQSTDTILAELRRQTLEGFNSSQMVEYKDLLYKNLETDDLEKIVYKIYEDNVINLKATTPPLLAFYVRETGSSPVGGLMDADLRRLLVDTAVAVNALLRHCRKKDFDDCGVSLSDVVFLQTLQLKASLPVRMSWDRKQQAVRGMRFLIDSDMNPDKINDMMTTFVGEFQTANENQNVIGKRVVNNKEIKISHDIAWDCFVLNTFKMGTQFKGLKQLIRVMYSLLECHRHPLNPADYDGVFNMAVTSNKDQPLSSNVATTEMAAVVVGEEEDEDACYEEEETNQPQPTTQPPQPPPTTVKTTQTTQTTEKTQPPTTKKTIKTTQPPTTTTETTQPPTSIRTTQKPTVRCGVSDFAVRMSAVQESSMLVTPRVIGGHLAGDCRTFPWMVRLSIRSGNSQFLCGGAIIDSTHILTAAHCVINRNSIRVFAGEYDAFLTDRDEQVFDVDMANGVFYHPGYSFFRKLNDIAVLKLPRPIDLSKPCATPICLDPTFNLTNGMTCDVAGWGKVRESDTTGRRFLQTVKVRVYDGEVCQAVFNPSNPNYMPDPSRQLCAGDPDVGGVDTCGGDSGGPLMCRTPGNQWVSVGVTSFGQGCGRRNNPGVYTETAAYYAWIQQIIK